VSAPPAGFDVVRIWFPPKATHSEIVGQDRPTAPNRSSGGREARFQTLAGTAGWSEVRTALPPSATQNETDGQETASIGPVALTPLDIQACTPAAGLVELRIRPALSPATHSDTDGQVMFVRLLMPPLGIAKERQADAPPSGCLETIASSGPPADGTSAMQKPALAHESVPNANATGS
jgi:hypothetical protein